MCASPCRAHAARSLAQVIRRSGHSYAADWWSLGVLLFEMLVGRTPFMPTHAKSESQLDHEESAMQLMRDVMACRIYWPDDATDEHSLSAESRDLISKLLKVNLSERLGYAGDERSGANDVINHPWFNDINMVAIMMRTMAPPYRPELDSPTDTSCFDVDLAEFSLKLRADRSASAPTFDSSLFDDW
jgi:serine/threonine protein kinase